MRKKFNETDSFEWFRAAYERVTGQLLRLERRMTHPTFLCQRPDGSQVGVEFTQINAPNPDKPMEGADGADLIEAALTTEADELHKPDWKCADSSILVVNTTVCPISEMELCFDRALVKEYAKTGFTEVWVADYTEASKFKAIELFGLLPTKWWGYHPHPLKKGKKWPGVKK